MITKIDLLHFSNLEPYIFVTYYKEFLNICIFLHLQLALA